MVALIIKPSSGRPPQMLNMLPHFAHRPDSGPQRLSADSSSSRFVRGNQQGHPRKRRWRFARYSLRRRIDAFVWVVDNRV
jgi:hypothetical protein